MCCFGLFCFFFQAENCIRDFHVTGVQTCALPIFGRLMRIAKICVMVLCPKSGIRAGELDPDDIRNFPVHLKRLLIAKTTLMVITLVWGVLAYALLKLK